MSKQTSLFRRENQERYLNIVVDGDVDTMRLGGFLAQLDAVYQSMSGGGHLKLRDTWQVTEPSSPQAENALPESDCPTVDESRQFTSKVLTCTECCEEFIFTAAAQEYFAERGYESDPKRCKVCYTQFKKQQRSSSKISIVAWESDQS